MQHSCLYGSCLYMKWGREQTFGLDNNDNGLLSTQDCRLSRWHCLAQSEISQVCIQYLCQSTSWQSLSLVHCEICRWCEHG